MLGYWGVEALLFWNGYPTKGFWDGGFPYFRSSRVVGTGRTGGPMRGDGASAVKYS